MNRLGSSSTLHRHVVVSGEEASLDARVIVPRGAAGIVVIPRGPSERHHRPLLRGVARALHDAGLATLTVNLLTPDEELADQQDGRFRRDLELLGARLEWATRWVTEQPGVDGVPVGYYALHATAAAALIAASHLPETVSAVVCHQGRPDLAEPVLRLLDVPCMFIVVGGGDEYVEMSRGAMALIRGSSELVVYEELLMPDVAGRITTAFFEREMCSQLAQ